MRIGFRDIASAFGHYLRQNIVTAILVVSSAAFLCTRWLYRFDPPIRPESLVWLLILSAAWLFFKGYRGFYLVSRANRWDYGVPALQVWSGFWIVMLLIPVAKW
jgi:hypothetical protein